MDNYKKDHTAQFDNYLKGEFEPIIAQHIKDLTNYLLDYRDTFLTVEKAKSMEKEKKEQLIQQLRLIMTKNKIQSNDINVIKNGLEVQV